MSLFSLPQAVNLTVNGSLSRFGERTGVATSVARVTRPKGLLQSAVNQNGWRTLWGSATGRGVQWRENVIHLE